MTSIRDLLRRKGRRVHVVSDTETVVKCAALMTELGIGSLVVHSSPAPTGIVTWHDILRVVAQSPERLRELPVSEIMSPAPETTTEDADLDDVKMTMVEKKIRHMPVVKDGEVVGLVTLLDVLHRALQDAHAMNDQLEDYIWGVQFD